jgi:hypothetical protein
MQAKSSSLLGPLNFMDFLSLSLSLFSQLCQFAAASELGVLLLLALIATL